MMAEQKGEIVIYRTEDGTTTSDVRMEQESVLFIWFLEKNGLLSDPDGERKMNDNALVALTLLVAESNPKRKDVMMKLIINLLSAR